MGVGGDLMARNPQAEWDPLPTSSGGAFTGGPRKGVAHKTQGDTYAGARRTYEQRSLGPHFTIAEDALLYQHLDTGEASSAVANDSGGVQTNRDGAIQVEIVGFSGQPATPAQIATFVDLQRWLHFVEGIPPTWPAGRPPTTSQDGYGRTSGHRDAGLWESTAGWYGHSQVPENSHWDPAWTDAEWALINQEDDDMFEAQDREDLQDSKKALSEILTILHDPVAGIKAEVLRTKFAVLGLDVTVDAEAIAAAIPDDLAQQVADELARRLSQ